MAGEAVAASRLARHRNRPAVAPRDGRRDITLPAAAIAFPDRSAAARAVGI
jgi:hypothetical protein